jgi:GNAT superfamily N-acetyltransferase
VVAIRAARATELAALQDIERAAGEMFRDIGMPAIADDAPWSLDVLAGFEKAGRLWVVSDLEDRPVGYLMAEPVDGCLHVEQVSVHTGSARHGLGRALLEHVASLATADGVPALTLTTFLNVPWNAPYYARCGFRILGDEGLTPGLREIRRHEAAIGLDRWPRVCMRRDLPGALPPGPPLAVDQFGPLVEELGPGRAELRPGLVRARAEHRHPMAVLEREPDPEVLLDGVPHGVAGEHAEHLAPLLVGGGHLRVLHAVGRTRLQVDGQPADHRPRVGQRPRDAVDELSRLDFP